MFLLYLRVKYPKTTAVKFALNFCINFFLDNIDRLIFLIIKNTKIKQINYINKLLTCGDPSCYCVPYHHSYS